MMIGEWCWMTLYGNCRASFESPQIGRLYHMTFIIQQLAASHLVSAESRVHTSSTLPIHHT